MSDPCQAAILPTPTITGRHRQSCDRCHAQKVRCVREKAFDDTELDTKCIRCKKADATCIYSYQKRPGRPLVNKDTAAVSSIPKRRRTLEQFYLANWGDGATSQNMLWTDTTWPELDLNEFLSPDPAFPLALGSGMTDFSHLDLSVLSHEMPVFGPDALASPWQDNATASDTARSELGLPEPLPDSAGGLMSRLAAMNLHIVSSTRSLADANPSLLSTTTSSVTALFETASALIGILDTRRARSSDQRGGTPAQYPDPAPDRLRGANRTRSLDPTVCFLVLACHQSLTAAFDTICLSIMAALEGFDPLTNSVFDPSGEVSPGELASEMRGGTMKSPVTQYVMLTALIEHFVERLDRALQSLAHELAAAGEGTAQTPPLDHAPQERTRIPGGAEPPDLVPLAADADPDPNARRPRSTGSGFDSPGPGMDENTSAGGMIESIESEGLANCYRTTMGLARAAQSRHERLLLRLGEVRKLVSASDSS